MTDLEKFTELYRSIGIKLEVKQEELGLQTIRLNSEWEKDCKFDGPIECYSKIVFDKNGKFVIQGFWDD